MTAEAWVFAIAWLVALAALAVVLLGAAAKQADDMEKRYLRLGARLLRSEAEAAALREDNANLEATVDHLRRGLLRAVEDEPVPFVPTPIYDDLTVERAAASLDDEWAELNGGDGA